jgi:hypothetical protein
VFEAVPSGASTRGPTTAGIHVSEAARRSSTKVGSSETSLLRTSSKGCVAAATPLLTADPKPPFSSRWTTVTPGTSGKGMGEQSSATISCSSADVCCAARSSSAWKVGSASP